MKIPGALFRWFALAVPLVRFASAQFTPAIQPTLTCTRYHSDTNILDAYFGYASSYTTNVSIPVGTSNFFTPADPNRNQPGSFDPGIHDRVFFTSFQVTPAQQSLTWFLGSGSATAAATVLQSCDPLRYLGAWNSTDSYSAYDLVSYQGNLWTPTFPLNVLPIRNITPGTDGNWTLYYPVGGVPGPPGPAGPPGPSGPSGVALITTVTVPTTTVTATASCNTTQVLISGGGTCTVPNTNSISGRIASSGPAGNNSWTVTCSAGQATAVALCAAK